MFDGHTDTATYARCLRLDADGDPQWWDEFSSVTAALSGEWAEALTPHTLMAALGVASDDDPHHVWEAALCDRYEDAFTNAWRDTVISTARRHCPLTRRGIFHLSRADEPHRTETVSVVVVADDEQAARKLAADHASNCGSSKGPTYGSAAASPAYGSVTRTRIPCLVS